MRKDVKFGLTIGGILVATLVVYVIVLSRGPEVPPKLGLVMPSSASGQSNMPQQTESLDTTPMPSGPSHTEVADNSITNESTTNEQAAPNDVATPSAQPPASDASAPATQPAEDPKNDWESALNHGMPPSLSAAAPQRTDAPMIDTTPIVSSAKPVVRDSSTPMIDSLPTTQPSPPAMTAAPQVMDNAAPAPIAQLTAPGTHRVEQGESLYSISRDVYGNSRYYKRILTANPGINPHHLKIGQILTIPVLGDADRNPAPVAGADAPAVDSSTAYKVVSGDTLEKISRKLYGNAGMINKLYDLNKSLIGSDQDMLKIGWVLKLPAPPTVASSR